MPKEPSPREALASTDTGEPTPKVRNAPSRAKQVDARPRQRPRRAVAERPTKKKQSWKTPKKRTSPKHDTGQPHSPGMRKLCRQADGISSLSGVAGLCHDTYGR
ncbi:hypothetical protein AB0C77_12810 [Streptomyces sp. NPDC048629]|uniref:hypothetical protein n=1 Tax=Streptomyces sp. NPDC048629 TaxID=3154824 RepID=UPI0034290290